MEDLQLVGGIPAVLKMLMEEKLIDGSCMTVTGKCVNTDGNDMMTRSECGFFRRYIMIQIRLFSNTEMWVWMPSHDLQSFGGTIASPEDPLFCLFWVHLYKGRVVWLADGL